MVVSSVSIDCIQSRDVISAEEKCASVKLKVFGGEAIGENLLVRAKIDSSLQDSQLRTVSWWTECGQYCCVRTCRMRRSVIAN